MPSTGSLSSRRIDIRPRADRDARPVWAPRPAWEPSPTRLRRWLRRGARAAALLAVSGLAASAAFAWPYLTGGPVVAAPPKPGISYAQAIGATPITEEESEPPAPAEQVPTPVITEEVVIPDFPPPVPVGDLGQAPPLPGITESRTENLPIPEAPPEPEAPVIPDPPVIPLPVQPTAPLDIPPPPGLPPQPVQPEKSTQPAEIPPPVPSEIGLPSPAESSTVKQQPDEPEIVPPPVFPLQMTQAPADPHPEEPPMNANLGPFGYRALVAGALAVAAPVAAGAQTEEELKSMSAALSKLDALVTKMTDLEKNLNEDVTKNSIQLGSLATEMAELKKTVMDLQSEMESIRGRLETRGPDRIANAPPAAGMGRVKLINEYLETVTVSVNGKAYVLAPGQTRNVDVPSGEFTYWVAEWRPVTQIRVVQEAEVFTIRVHPQS